MADNVTITQGTGTSVATDDVGGAHYQRVKLDVGGDGASVPVVTSLPVSLVAGTALAGKVGIDQTTPGTTNAVAVISGQAGVAGGAGAVSALVQRTTLASDDPAVAALGATSGAAVITDAAGTIQQYLRGLVKLLITTGTIILGAGSSVIGKVGIDQTTPGTTDRVTAGGKTVSVDANFTRPADTTAYATNDSLTNSTSAPTVLTFSNAARASGGSGVILDAILIDESNPGTVGSFDLMLYDTTFTPTNDNAAFNPSTTIQRTFVGKISFSTQIVCGTTSQAYHATGVNLAFVTVGSANLFGQLVARNAYTPANTGRFDLRLKVLQD